MAGHLKQANSRNTASNCFLQPFLFLFCSSFRLRVCVYCLVEIEIVWGSASPPDGPLTTAPKTASDSPFYLPPLQCPSLGILPLHHNDFLSHFCGYHCRVLSGQCGRVKWLFVSPTVSSFNCRHSFYFCRDVRVEREFIATLSLGDKRLSTR